MSTSKLLGLSLTVTSAIGAAMLMSAPGASAIADRCDQVKSSGATASVRCAGPGAFTSFQFVINCYDGISDYQYSIASAWEPRGATVKLTCGAPQRQYVVSTYANFR